MKRLTFLTLLPLFALTAFSASAADIDTAEIYSPSMRKLSKCLIIKPANYTVQGTAYPVLYLLHGWSGNFAGWLTDAPQLRRHADTYNMLIVCPDGGYDSWYLDSPVDTNVCYETHLSVEVVNYVDYYYHTRRDQGGRAIAGLSMGGHGALLLAARHPDVFGAAGSMCGGLDLRPFKKNGWDLEGVLGRPSAHWKNWEDNSVLNAIKLLKKSHIPLIIDCGLGDFFLDVNRAMHQRLIEEKIAHEYTERPGEHNHEYWGNAIDYQIVFFDKFFRK